MWDSATEPLWPEEKWDVFALSFFFLFLLKNFFSPSGDIELILSCSL